MTKGTDGASIMPALIGENMTEDSKKLSKGHPGVKYYEMIEIEACWLNSHISIPINASRKNNTNPISWDKNMNDWINSETILKKCILNQVRLPDLEKK